MTVSSGTNRQGRFRFIAADCPDRHVSSTLLSPRGAYPLSSWKPEKTAVAATHSIGTIEIGLETSNDPAWVIVSDRAGDARQAIALADAIGVPYRVMRAVPAGGSILHKSVPPGCPMDFLDDRQSSRFGPPWPQFFLTVGNWPTAVALWLRARAAPRTPVVLLGRPKPRQLDQFAAIVASSQYLVPPHPAIVQMTFPPRSDAALVDNISSAMADVIARMSAPITAVFIGGATASFRLDGRFAGQFANDLNAIHRRDGGSLYIVTSARTPADVTQMLRDRLVAEAELFEWRDHDQSRNPYAALLRLADRFVVTGDSVSMMIDAAAQRRPLAIAALPLRRDVKSAVATVRARLASRSIRSGGRACAVLIALHRLGIIGFSRDITAIHEALFCRGLATRFATEPFKQPVCGLPREMERVGMHVRRALRIAATQEFEQRQSFVEEAIR
jgi:uncharacterized protein